MKSNEKTLRDLRIFIHVGLPKSGTTFLQRGVFCNIKNINFINGSNTHNKKLRNLLQEICRDNRDVNLIKNELIEFFNKNALNLISFESLFGDVFSKDMSLSNQYDIADRIYSMFPNGKIIFITRKLDTFIPSLYSQYVKQGGIKNYEDFVIKVINMERFNFEKYIKYLKNIFGKNNVYISQFEILRTDHKNFVSGICNFIGVPVPDIKIKNYNISYGKRQIQLALKFNKFFKTRFNPQGKFPYLKEYPRFFPPRLLLENKLSQLLHYEKYEPEELNSIINLKKDNS